MQPDKPAERLAFVSVVWYRGVRFCVFRNRGGALTGYTHERYTGSYYGYVFTPRRFSQSIIGNIALHRPWKGPVVDIWRNYTGDALWEWVRDAETARNRVL